MKVRYEELSRRWRIYPDPELPVNEVCQILQNKGFLPRKEVGTGGLLIFATQKQIDVLKDEYPTWMILA